MASKKEKDKKDIIRALYCLAQLTEMMHPEAKYMEADSPEGNKYIFLFAKDNKKGEKKIAENAG